MEHLPIILLCGSVGLVNGWNKAFALLLSVPLGVCWTWAAISGLLEPWLSGKIPGSLYPEQN